MTAIAHNPHQSSAETQKSMKERPILFKGQMVRPVLAGTKTQTRRVVKAPASVTAIKHFDGLRWDRMQGNHRGDTINCPYGQPGDRLWVRETWQGPLIPADDPYPDDMYTPKFCEYAADGGPTPEFSTADDELVCRWRPSIHMPRWASRITLEVTGVRVERLQDISCYDALAEGISHTRDGFGMPDGSHFHCNDPRQSYFSLWETINGPGSVAANPRVWVVEFQRVKGLAA